MNRLAALSLVVATACTAERYAADADREVLPLLDDGIRAVEDGRRTRLRTPAPAQPAEKERTGGNADGEAEEPPALETAQQVGADLLAGLPTTEQGVPIVGLDAALRIAVRINREYQSRREALYQTGLGITLTRFGFGPQFGWTVRSLYADVEDGAERTDLGTSFGVSQILPTGGTIGLDASYAGVRQPGLPTSYSSGIGIGLRQPLLRGFGYEVSHEPLTQAERGLVYSVRDFVLFQQGFSIGVAADYFDLLQQREILRNQEQDHETAVFDLRKAEALFQTDRVNEQEVFRARRRALDSENQLVDARAEYQRAIDQFKIRLGLPIDVAFELAQEEPIYELLDIDVDSAIEVARHNRIDLLTQRQQIEDAERGLRIAGNGLLPDLDLTVDYALGGFSDAAGRAAPDDWSASVGLVLDIPLQRKAERNAYRSAMIGLLQAQRGYRQTLDQLEVDIRNQIRQLRSTEQRIELQEQQIQEETQTVAVNEIRFEQGILENRELIDARQALINARNTLVRLKVTHFIGRLQLMRDLGTLFIDGNGKWQ